MTELLLSPEIGRDSSRNPHKSEWAFFEYGGSDGKAMCIGGGSQRRLGGNVRRGRFLGGVPFGATLFVGFVGGDQEERDERDGEQEDRGDPGELLHFADQQGETAEDEEKMRAEDLERGLAQGEEGLARDHHADILAQPVKDDQEGGDIENAERTDLPFVEQEAQRLLGEVGTDPGVAHGDEEEANRRAESDSPPGNELQRHVMLCRTRTQTGEGATADPLLALILSISHANPGNQGDDARLSEDLGLDSLGRVQLQSELEQRLGLTLDDEALERAITLGDLRRELGLHSAASSPAEPAERAPESSAIPSAVAASTVLPRAQDQPRKKGEDDLYPRWPWWWPVRLVRDLYLELVSRFFVWLLGNPRVERPPNLHPERPVLLVANHVTAYDAALVLYGLPGPMRRRVVVAMAGDMLRDFRHMRNVGPQGRAVTPFLDVLGPPAWLLITALYNVFPLPRSAGFRRSFQHAGEALDHGYNVLVFPEGFRTEAGLQPFRPGIGLLVHESDAPVIPVALAGLSELKQQRKGWFRSGKLTVRVGEPIRFTQDDTPEQITSRLYDAVKAMLDQK